MSAEQSKSVKDKPLEMLIQEVISSGADIEIKKTKTGYKVFAVSKRLLKEVVNK